MVGQLAGAVYSQLHRARPRTGKWVRRWTLESCGCPDNLPACHRSKRGLWDLLSPPAPGQSVTVTQVFTAYSTRPHGEAAVLTYLYCLSALAVVPAQSKDSLPGPNATKQESVMWVLHGLRPMSLGTRTKGRNVQMFPSPTLLRPHPCTAPSLTQDP